MNSTLEISQLANIFGTTVDGLGKNCQNFYNNLDMGYEVIEGDEREDLILNILKAIEEDKKVVATPQRTEVWYNGWKENLDDFTANQTINDIIPKFYKPNNIVRLNKQYIKPSDPYFEINYVKLILLYICNRFIGSDIKNVYEFGCGTGFNLITLAEQRKDVNMYGADFVQSSVDLTNEIGNQFNLKIQGSLFNMIEPSYNFQICKDSCAFTFASIEQIANQSANFINYLLHQKPRICFHIIGKIEISEMLNQ